MNRRSFLSSLFVGALGLVCVKKTATALASVDGDAGTCYQHTNGVRIVFLPKHPVRGDEYPLKYRNEEVIYMADDVPINGLEIGEGLHCSGVNCGRLLYLGRDKGWTLGF